LCLTLNSNASAPVRIRFTVGVSRRDNPAACSGGTARTYRSVFGKPLRRCTRRYSPQRDEFYHTNRLDNRKDGQLCRIFSLKNERDKSPHSCGPPKVRACRNPGRIACLFESETLFFGYARESVIAVTGCANDVLADPTN
jgi:hypothetical protein